MKANLKKCPRRTPNGKFHLIVTLIWSIASGQGHATPSDHGQNICTEPIHICGIDGQILCE